jgi:LPXTG-motif cell wall-anchored protein
MYCENLAKVNTTYPAAVRVAGPPQPPASYPIAKPACVPAVTPGLTSGGGGQSLPNTSTAAPGIGGILLGAAALGAAALVRRRTRPLPLPKADDS